MPEAADAVHHGCLARLEPRDLDRLELAQRLPAVDAVPACLAQPCDGHPVTGAPEEGGSPTGRRSAVGSVGARALKAELVAFRVGEDKPPRAGWLIVKDGCAESD